MAIPDTRLKRVARDVKNLVYQIHSVMLVYVYLDSYRYVNLCFPVWLELNQFCFFNKLSMCAYLCVYVFTLLGVYLHSSFVYMLFFRSRYYMIRLEWQLRLQCVVLVVQYVLQYFDFTSLNWQGRRVFLKMTLWVLLISKFVEMLGLVYFCIYDDFSEDDYEKSVASYLSKLLLDVSWRFYSFFRFYRTRDVYSQLHSK